ncbi:MAG: hypothetical protein AAF682_14380 [Planctomycetota bacterium]
MKPVGSLSLSAAFLLVAPSALAAQCVDQQQLDATDQDQVIHSQRTVAQTFVSDGQAFLEGLEVSLWEQGLGVANDLALEVLDASGGDLSTAPVLATVFADEGDLGPSPFKLDPDAVTATYFDLSFFNIVLQAGDELAFRFSTSRVLPNRYLLRIALVDVYTSGEYHVDDAPLSGADAGFKTFFGADGSSGFFFGSGVNPPILHPSLVPPTIGGVFEPLLTTPLTAFDLSYLLSIGFPGPIVPIGSYEVLMQLPAPVTIPAVVGFNPILIPDSCDLVGIQLRAQVLSIVGGPSPGVALTNAVEMRIGG